MLVDPIYLVRPDSTGGAPVAGIPHMPATLLHFTSFQFHKMLSTNLLETKLFLLLTFSQVSPKPVFGVLSPSIRAVSHNYPHSEKRTGQQNKVQQSV